MASWVMGTGIHFEKPKPQMPLLMTMIMMMWWPNTLEKWLCALGYVQYVNIKFSNVMKAQPVFEILSPKFTKQCFLCCYGFSGKRGNTSRVCKRAKVCRRLDTSTILSRLQSLSSSCAWYKCYCKKHAQKLMKRKAKPGK